MSNQTNIPTNSANDTFRVIIRFPSRKYEWDPGKPGKKRIAIGYGEPILFWDDEYIDGRGVSCTTCFTMSESHGAASWEYFHKDCHTPKTEEEKRLADKLFEWYLAFCKEPQFKGEPLPVRRLKRYRPRFSAATA